MTRQVMCKKYQKELEGLDFPPIPGPKGQELFESISKQAWGEGRQHQTMLINEKRLSLMDPRTREYLNEQMEKFFCNADDMDQAEGYVPPSETP